MGQSWIEPVASRENLIMGTIWMHNVFDLILWPQEMTEMFSGLSMELRGLPRKEVAPEIGISHNAKPTSKI
jgi:iron only hydrogenase large subunit-like protein